MDAPRTRVNTELHAPLLPRSSSRSTCSSRPASSQRAPPFLRTVRSVVSCRDHQLKEMMQPGLIHLHVISLEPHALGFCLVP